MLLTWACGSFPRVPGQERNKKRKSKNYKQLNKPVQLKYCKQVYIYTSVTTKYEGRAIST